MQTLELTNKFLAVWKPTVRENTYSNHSKMLLLHLGELKNKNIEEITGEALASHLLNMEKTLSKNYIAQWLNLFRRVIAYGIKNNLVKTNLLEEILPIKRQEFKIVNTITPFQFSKLKKEWGSYKNTKDLQEKILFLELMFFTGLRHAEVRALQVHKFNKDNNTLLINNSIDYKSKNDLWKLTETKSKSSNRVITLNNSIANKLKEFITTKKTEDFIFCDSNGTPRTQLFAKSLLAKGSIKLGIKINPHGLRHSHASFLVASGVPIQMVQKRLGHSDPSTTMKLYSHLNVDETEIIDLLEKVC